MPACQTSAGCEIEKLAKNKEIQSKVDAFQQVKVLQKNVGYDDIIKEILISNDLNDADLLIKLEGIVSEWLQYKAKNHKLKTQKNPANQRQGKLKHVR